MKGFIYFLWFVALFPNVSAAEDSKIVWKVFWPMMTQVDVTLEGQPMSSRMSEADINKASSIAPLFKRFMEENASNQNVEFQMSPFISNTPITHLTKRDSKDSVDEYDFWLTPEDLPADVKNAVRNYDLVLGTVRLPLGVGNGWWGMASWWTNIRYGIIRFLEGSPENEYWYFDDGLPAEAIYVHEALHTILGYFETLGYEIPDLDDEKYYSDDETTMAFYRDIVGGKLIDATTGKNLGITSEMWAKSPQVSKPESPQPSTPEPSQPSEPEAPQFSDTEKNSGSGCDAGFDGVALALVLAMFVGAKFIFIKLEQMLSSR